MNRFDVNSIVRTAVPRLIVMGKSKLLLSLFFFFFRRKKISTKNVFLLIHACSLSAQSFFQPTNSVLFRCKCVSHNQYLLRPRLYNTHRFFFLSLFTRNDNNKEKKECKRKASQVKRCGLVLLSVVIEISFLCAAFLCCFPLFFYRVASVLDQPSILEMLPRCVTRCIMWVYFSQHPYHE